jgi:hypothetical protein
MKKIIYLFAILLTVFTSCTPLEDIHNEIDALPEAPNVAALEYTLEDADYDTLDLSFGNFSSEDDAKSMLPDFLASKFNLYGEGSTVNTTFKVYAPKRDEKSLKVYKVSSQDYTDAGHTFGNFSRSEHITDFLNTKYPSPADRLLVSLTYKYYSGSVATLNNGFLFVNNEWQMITGFTNDEYTAMGEGFSNFSSEEEALSKTPIFLLDKFKFDGKVKGDIEGIMYKLYITDVDDVDGDGRTDDRAAYSYVVYFIFDGTNWSKYSNVKDSSVKFGHDGSKWVPDNTIRYTLTDADYTLVGNGFYKNFDVRAGKDEEKESVRLEKVNTILLNNFSSVDGQKYVVSYAVYDGTNAIWEMKVINTGGVYILQ